MKKLILIGAVLLLLTTNVFAYYYFNASPSSPQVYEFENSEWNYIPKVGFVTDDALEKLDKQAFAERSREYFLEEIR